MFSLLVGWLFVGIAFGIPTSSRQSWDGSRNNHDKHSNQDSMEQHLKFDPDKSTLDHIFQQQISPFLEGGANSTTVSGIADEMSNTSVGIDTTTDDVSNAAQPINNAALGTINNDTYLLFNIIINFKVFP